MPEVLICSLLITNKIRYAIFSKLLKQKASQAFEKKYLKHLNELHFF